MTASVLRGSVCLISLAMATCPALAQNSEQASAAQSAEARGSAPIVVTARRVEENLQDIPIAVTALGSAALDNMSVREMRDLTSIVPNLNIRTSSNDGQSALVAIRGQVPAGVLLTTDSAVGLYFDGINNPRSIGFRGALVDISRVEVLRGPQGTLYGRNTTGGAISVISNSPVNDWEGMARVRLGNHSAASALGVINIPLGDQFAARFVAQRGISDGYGSDFDGQELVDENSTYLRGKLRADFGAVTAELTTDYQRNSGGGPIYRLSGLTQFTTPVGGLGTVGTTGQLGLSQDPAGWAVAIDQLSQYLFDPDDGDAYRSGGRNNSSFFEGVSAGLDINAELSSNLSIRSLTGYRNVDRNNEQDIDSTPFDIIQTRYLIEDEFFSQELQILGDFPGFNFVLGGYYSHEDGFETSAPSILGGNFGTAGGFVTSESTAVFGQFNWEITDRLTLTGGARYTWDTKSITVISHANQNFINVPLEGTFIGCTLPVELLDNPGACRASREDSFSDPSWLISADYDVTDSMLVYAKVARGFRAGGQNLRGNSLFTLQPFGPETITEYEIGLKSEFFDRRVRLNIAAFYDEYNGVQRTVALVSGASTFSLVTNAAQARITGVEVEANVRPFDNLEIQANVGYIHPRYLEFVDATGDRSNEDWPTPDWTYAVSARYTVPLDFGQLQLQADYQGQSRQNVYPAVARQPEDVTQGAYGLLNGRISLSVDDEDFEVALFGRNLLGETYIEGGLSLEALGQNYINVGEPRVFGIELTKRF